jgi:hypothetical protein
MLVIVWLAILGAPLVVAFIITAVRWEKFKRYGGHPKIQFHISDLLIGSLWIAAVGAVLSNMRPVSDRAFLSIVLLGSTTAGILLGKLWQLSSRTKSLGHSAAYISLGVVSSLAMTYTPIIVLSVIVHALFRCC